jgi:hypothetical protein
MTELNIKHPKTCFGISRHNEIIPLKVVDVVDYEDGFFNYTLEINHPNPTDYMKCHHKADFQEKIVSPDAPLCDEHTRVRLTLDEAKALVTKQLCSDRAAAMMTVSNIDKRLAELDADIAEIRDTIL